MRVNYLKTVIASAALSVASLGYAAELSEVSTDSGIYQGHGSPYADNVSVFQGISFAAPPVRDLRWKPPAPAIPFAGVRQADRIGPACWQARNSMDSVYARGNLSRSEDCLYLNVYSGAADSDESLPVLVWFHGGSNTAGHAGPLIFEGSNLAKRGAVVVTANYRLGPFGFLAHPALTNESENRTSGNYGILDQIQALQWVQDNIAGFGGDPDRVTIFGQSAGGTDVCLIMSSPLAEGLVDGVIGQSPGCVKLKTPLEGNGRTGHQHGESFARAMGISGSGDSALEELRSVSPQQIISTVSEAGAGGPIVDGYVIPDTPYNLLQSGGQNRIPVIVGALKDEYYGLQQGAAEITEEQLDNYLQSAFGDYAQQIKASYTEELAESPLDARKVIAGDNGFLLSSRMWARLVRERGDDAYVYYFTRPTPVFRLYVDDQPDLNGIGGQRTLGAYHSGDLAYVFNNLDLVGMGWEDGDRVLSDTIADYWVNFARSGNPNGPGVPEWPVYDPETDIVQILDAESRAAVHPRKQVLDQLESVYLQQQ